MTTEYTDHFRLNLPDFRMGPWHDLVNQDFVDIDQLLFSIYQGVDTQPWANNTTYNPGTTAIDPDDNTFWVCIQAHTSAPTGSFADDRAANPGYWNRVVVGIAPRGEWENNTHYLPNDMVSASSEHVIAVCIEEHTSNATGTIRDDAAYWSFIADIGSVAADAAHVSYDNTHSGTTQTNLQSTTDELYTSVDANSTAIGANTSDITSLKTRTTALETSDASQNTAISGNTTAITTNASNITALTTRVTNTENVNSTQDTRIGNLEAIGAISDAPNDGKSYARKNHNWVDVNTVVTSGSTVYVSDTPPAGASDSSLWWESDTGNLYIKYNDGDSSQWVIAIPALDAGSFLAKTGDTMTGPLVLSGDPTVALGAATKQYVDAGDKRPSRLISAGDTLHLSDHGKLIILSSTSNFTLALDPAATLADGWYCDIANTNTGIVVVDPNGSEVIDSVTAINVYTQERMRIVCASGQFITLNHTGDWVVWTPTYSSTGGGTPTITSVVARYKKVRNSVTIAWSGTVSGTAGVNFLVVSLPVSMTGAVSFGTMVAQEYAANGKMCYAFAQGGSMQIRFYDNGLTMGTSGYGYAVTGTYECIK